MRSTRAVTPWRVHGLSVQGYRHRREGVPCQDACGHLTVGPSGSPVAVLAVADGAGSRSRSAEGSRLAVDLATRCFGELADDMPTASGAVRGLMLRTLRDVRREFLSRTGGDADDFATTLTVVLLGRDWLCHLSVGDGFVVVRAGQEDGVPQYHLLPQPDAVSEYSNETVFLTAREAETMARADYVRDEGIDGVLVSTDGLAQAALSWSGGRPRRPHVQFAAAVLKSIDLPQQDLGEQDLRDWLQSDRISALNADDKTLVRAVRAFQVGRT